MCQNLPLSSKLTPENLDLMTQFWESPGFDCLSEISCGDSTLSLPGPLTGAAGEMG